MLDDDEYFLDAGGIEKHLTQYQEHQDRAVVSFKCVAKADGNVSPQGITTSQKISSFMGGNVLFHIPSVLSVGGYRDFFVYGAEEADLAFRLFRKGFHIWYDPSIVVEHNQWYSPDEHRDFREYDYLYARNFILLSSMNMPILIGLPHGFLKSLRWSISRNRNFSSKFKGITSGLLESVTRWQERQPCTFRQTITWLKRHKQSQK
jgi:GT2 family glycosyltransferase